MNPPHMVGPYGVHQCVESYLSGRTRWLIFLFRQCHIIRSTGFGGATIERTSWPHADKLQEEYFTVVQGFDIIRGELSKMIEEESKRSEQQRAAEQRASQSRTPSRR